MKYNSKSYVRSSDEPSIYSNQAVADSSSDRSNQNYNKKEPHNKPYSVLQRVKPRNRKRVENRRAGGTVTEILHSCPTFVNEREFLNMYSPVDIDLWRSGGRVPGILSGYNPNASVGISESFPNSEYFKSSVSMSAKQWTRKDGDNGLTKLKYIQQNPFIFTWSPSLGDGGEKFDIKVAQMYSPKPGMIMNNADILGFKIMAGIPKNEPNQEYGFIQWYRNSFDCAVSDVYKFKLGHADTSDVYLSMLPGAYRGAGSGAGNAPTATNASTDVPLAGVGKAAPQKIEGKDINDWRLEALKCTRGAVEEDNDSKWWLKYFQLMWNDEEHYNCYKDMMDENWSDGLFRTDLRDLPGPGRDTWNWNKGQSTSPNTEGSAGISADRDAAAAEALHPRHVNVLYYSRQAYEELTFEILNGNLKNASKKEIRRKWLIKLMNHITTGFLDFMQDSSMRLEWDIEGERVKHNGTITEPKLNELINHYKELIEKLSRVLADNIRLVNIVYICGGHTLIHDHDPVAYFTIINQELDGWLDMTRDHYKYALTIPGTAVGHHGGNSIILLPGEDPGEFTMVDPGNDSPEDTDDEGVGMPPNHGDPAACNEATNACNNGVQPACIYYRTECGGGMGAAGQGLATGVGNAAPVPAGDQKVEFPSKQNTEIFKRISKLLISAIIKDEPIPSEIIEIFNSARVRTGYISPGTAEDAATLLFHHNEKMKEEFGENAPQLDISTSPMSKYFTVMSMVANHPNFEQQMTGIKMIMSYLSLHMKGESEWIIETFRELLDSRYKNTKPIIFAVQMIKKLGDVVKASEGVNDTNVTDTVAAAGRAAERVADLEAQLAARRERVTELQTQLAARPTHNELVSLKLELETARGNIRSLEEGVEALTAARDAALSTQDDQALAAVVGIAGKSDEIVGLKMEQIEELGEEIINLKAELEAEKTRNNVPVDAEQIRKEEQDECKKEINIFKGKSIEEVKKVNKEWEKDIESKDKMIKYGGIGAGVVIVLLILFLLMK